MLAMIVLCAALAGAPLQPAGQRPIAGTVRDGSGRAVPMAVVVLRTASGAETRSVTGNDGRFLLAGSGAGELLLIVRAEGFATDQRHIPGGARSDNLEFVLTPATVAETVTVSAARAEQRTADVAASISVIGQPAIERSPALVADDILRQVPTFSLFRRTSSLAAHPTTQGVSLRGIGPSGVSRTLVLFDGIPFNDPFGGWVYWTRVPLASIDRIEIVDGATSSVYGNYAMGGLVNIITAPPGRRTLNITSQYGSRNTPKLDVAAAETWGALRGSVDGSLFRTDGYAIVADNERGAVDTRASVEFANATAKLQYDITERMHAFVRGWHFREARDNGKISTIDGRPEANRTRWTSASAGVSARLPDDSDLQASAFVDATRFDSTFLAVPATTPARSLGRMSLEQTVPATGVGGMTQWRRALGARHFLSAGADARWVDGESQERVLDSVSGTRPVVSRISGGTQRSAGAYVQDIFTPAPRLVITGAARIDYWRNDNGHNLETTIPANVPTANNRPSLPVRRDTVVSPRISALYHVMHRVSVWGAVGAGFRAPTLNELYRQFRVGTVTTLANERLGPERLLGGEAGIRVAPHSSLLWRTTWFDNRVDGAVANVTVSASVAGVTQRRENVGRTRVRGVQTDLEYRARRSLVVSGAYVYTHATVSEFSANPALVGRVLPQVPRHRGSMRASYSGPARLSVSIGVQATGRQFDDDLNVRTVPGQNEPGLPGYAVVALGVSKALSGRVEIFGGVQNLFGTEYYVGTLPTTLGTPRLVHGGVRVRLPGR